MRLVPRTLQTKLPQLLGLLKQQGYAADPQLMFGAIGDATCDRAPLQVGQFESDNRMDGDLEHILLEGGGGGQKTESYELAMYFMARHTAPTASRSAAGAATCSSSATRWPTRPSSLGEVQGLDRRRAAAAGRHPQPRRAAHQALGHLLHPARGRQPTQATRQVLGTWRSLLGQNVIELADLDAVCETIALTVGLGEEAIDLDEGLADLADVGSAAGPAVRRPSRRIGAYQAGPVRRRALRAGPVPRALPASSTGGPTWTFRPAACCCEGHVIVVDLGYGDAGKGTSWTGSARGVRDARTPTSGGVRSRRSSASTAARRRHTTCSAPRRRAARVRPVRLGHLHPGDAHVPVQVRARRPRSPWSPRRSTWPASGVPDPLGLLAIDPDALLTTPYHRAANRAREEARGDGRHGSCGMGIGETARYALDHPQDAPAPATSRAPAP